MVVLAYLPKLKIGLGLAFGAHLLSDFFIKCVLFNNLSIYKVISSNFLLKISNKMCEEVFI